MTDYRHFDAKLYDIVAALTLTQPPEIQQRILEVGTSPDFPYLVEPQGDGTNLLNVNLADGTLIPLGTFHGDELSEPFVPPQP